MGAGLLTCMYKCTFSNYAPSLANPKCFSAGPLTTTSNLWVLVTVADSRPDLDLNLEFYGPNVCVPFKIGAETLTSKV